MDVLATINGQADAQGTAHYKDSVVRNDFGEVLGEVEDLVINPISGQIKFALVSLGGFLGLGDKLFPVPWWALTRSDDGGEFVLSIPDHLVESAPRITRHAIEMIDDREFADELEAFYQEHFAGEPSQPVFRALANDTASRQQPNGRNVHHSRYAVGSS